MARPRSFDESQVVARARKAFHDHGYAGASIDQLCQATGLRRSSLYGAFGDKHGIFLAAMDAYCDDVVASVEQQLAGGEHGALARLERHVRGQAADPAGLARGCLLAKATAERAAEDPDVARRAAEAFDRYEAALAGCIRQAQSEREVRDDIDPEAAAALVLAVLRGIEALGRSQRSPEALCHIANTALSALAPVAAIGRCS